MPCEAYDKQFRLRSEDIRLEYACRVAHEMAFVFAYSCLLRTSTWYPRWAKAERVEPMTCGAQTPDADVNGVDKVMLGQSAPPAV